MQQNTTKDFLFPKLQLYELVFPAAILAEMKSNTCDLRVAWVHDTGDADFVLKCLQNTQQGAIGDFLLATWMLKQG